MDKSSIIILFSAVLFLSPLFIHLNPPLSIENIHLGLPHTYSGDEPHYLIFVNSLIEDHDLLLTNNYDLLGSNALSHHTFHINDEKEVTLHSTNLNSTDPEYSLHPIGLPLFVSLLLWPLAYSKYLESGAIILSSLISMIGLYFLYKLLYFYSKNKRISLITTAIFAFATPLWAYSRSFYSEPYIWSLSITAFYFFITRKNYPLSGFLTGLAFLMKWPAAIFTIVLSAHLVIKKRYKSCAIFLSSFSLFLIVQLVYNYLILRSPFRFTLLEFPSTHGEAFNILYKITYVLFLTNQRHHALFAFAPILIFSIIGFYYFFKRDREQAFLVLTLIFAYLAFFTVDFRGDGHSYGPRQIIPIIPLFAIPTAIWIKHNRSKFLLTIFLILVALSFLINFFGVFGYEQSFSQSPLETYQLFFP